MEKKVTISYAISVCNEIEEIKKLVSFLQLHKRKEDEIVILYDFGGTEEVLKYLDSLEDVPVVKDNFKGHFADWKNKLSMCCKGDYIFQIDADELPNEELINNIPYILEINQEVDAFLVPRVNTVEGLTPQHIEKWGWEVNEKGWVNFPDYQWRIYRRTENITWINKVHERLTGFKTISNLPPTEEYSLYHPKTIDRQEKQNNYYDTL
jgi:hypothetical protein